MDKKTTGGPAFPESYGHPRNHWIGWGMTLRDYFAAKAMQALITAKAQNMSLDSRGWPIFAETDAWKIADAMLSERNK